jgi:cytochrome c553
MKKILLTLVSIGVGIAVASAADVKENWETHCAKCHGSDGTGKTKMGQKLKVKDYTDPKVQEKLKDEEMIKIIKEGKKEGDKTLMKGYTDELSDAEIKALVEYIRKFKK